MSRIDQTTDEDCRRGPGDGPFLQLGSPEFPDSPSPEDAPDGQIYVCAACGKTSKSIYGDPGSGFDVSCFLNRVLCHEGYDEIMGCWHAVAGWRRYG